MKVTALRQFDGREGLVRRGQTIDVPAHRARALEQNGLVVAEVGAKMKRKPKNKMAGAPSNKAKGDASDPSKARPTGGRTGARKRQSLSPAGPQPEKPSST